jgi:hypothetical protein
MGSRSITRASSAFIEEREDTDVTRDIEIEKGN